MWLWSPGGVQMKPGCIWGPSLAMVLDCDGSICCPTRWRWFLEGHLGRHGTPCGRALSEMVPRSHEITLLLTLWHSSALLSGIIEMCSISKLSKTLVCLQVLVGLVAHRRKGMQGTPQGTVHLGGDL